MARSFVSRFASLGRPVVVLGAIAVLLTAGCGTSGPSGSSPSASATSATSSATTSTPAVAGVDACSLVTASEASAAVGGEALTRDAASTAVQCDYVGQNFNTKVEITVRKTTPTEFATRCANSSAFPGVGDAACGAPKAFLLLKGTTEVDFFATTILGAGQVTMNFSTLAKTVISRL